MKIDLKLVKRDLEKIKRKDPGNAKVIANYLSYLEIVGHNVKRPKADMVKNGIYELRPNDYRLLYFYNGDEAVILHVFVKKESSIPQRHIQTAQQRKQTYLEE